MACSSPSNSNERVRDSRIQDQSVIVPTSQVALRNSSSENVLHEQFQRHSEARLIPHQLCVICEDIMAVIQTAKKSKISGYFLHHESEEHLKISAATGCHLCSLLSRALDLSYNNRTKKESGDDLEDDENCENNEGDEDDQDDDEDVDDSEEDEMDNSDIYWHYKITINAAWDAHQLLQTKVTAEELIQLTNNPESAPRGLKPIEIGAQLLVRLFFPWILDSDDKIRKGLNTDFGVDDDDDDVVDDVRIGTLMISVKDNHAGLRKVSNNSMTIEHFHEPWHEGPLKDPLTCIWTGSQAISDLGRDWLQTCITQHESCRAMKEDLKSGPSRLLDLQRLYEYSEIRLVYTKDLQEKDIQYTTLSHRWGKSKILRLTEENHDSLTRGIPIQDLTLVFQDATRITRDLGCNFLWVDSLCILQDSEEDWRNESKNMGEIYRGCICNIAVLDVERGSEGCFSLRNPLQYIPCRVPSNAKDDNLVVCGTPAGLWVDECELSARGWVFQERILSPRTLYYSRTKVGWECREGDASEHSVTIGENSIWGITFPRMKSTLLDLVKPFEKSPDPLLSDRSSHDFYSAWIGIVSSYTACNLTFGKDKLVALHGIMQLIANRIGLHPIAGLWQEFLPVELLWHYRERPCYINNEPPIEPRYRAPSWSWAAGEGEVWNWTAQDRDSGGFPESKLYAAILHVEVQSHENGEVSYGELHIQAPLLEFEPYGISEWERDYFDRADSHLTHYVVPILRNAWCRVEDIDEKGKSEEQDEEEKNSGYEEHGIVLSTSEQRPGVYVRVGYYHKIFESAEKTPAADLVAQDFEKQKIILI